ncbi:MAG: ClbS/DfsB family four-helix bundle protein [Actinomycetota bacterium]
MNKRDELLKLEEERWTQLCRLLDRVPDWEKLGVADDWSVKDLLGHLAAWHATTIDRLEQLRSKGELPPPPEDIDAFNAKTREDNKDLSLHDVKVMSGACRHRFREEVAAMDDEAATKFERMIYGNAHGHYEEHIPQIEAYVQAVNA